MTVAEQVATVVAWMRESNRTIALTGAGVSTDSGIPDFRSAESGLWRDFDPLRVASIQGFRHDPRGFYAFWHAHFASLGQAQPNLTHRTLAALEARGLVHSVVTQNIDGLHQLAGSRRVIEAHGTWRTARCTTCGSTYDTLAFLAELHPGETPSCHLCSGLVKPDVVLFDEPLPRAFAVAETLVESADLLIAMGTGLEVWPVAGLPVRARAAGARVVVINRDETAFDGDADLVVHAELREAMTRIARAFVLPL